VQGGDKACEGAGEGELPCWGGGVIRDLILLESEEHRGARDVEIGAYFFRCKRNIGGN
jgi:hypothetical protein